MTAARSFLFDLYLALVTAVMGLACLPALADRRAARAVTRLWAQTVLGGLALICGIRHRIEGEENIPNEPMIVAANHQSMWETIALLAVLPRPAVVFKKELLRVPVYGWWAHRTGGLGPLQPGIAGMYLIADKPVVPVVHNSGEFWRYPSGMKTPGVITMRFLPPIPSKLTRRAFMPALDAALRQPPDGGRS